MSTPGLSLNPTLARQFAVDVVRRLRDAGYTALWAGGCVRDQLLGGEPKDYDVATDARPEQIRQLFGHRRTLAIGAAFGVITVVGSKATGQIEVATFRCDVGYSDGRHPDSVTFSSAEEDAQRRDFTINGLFFDPLAERVIDYVGGVADLERRIVRAIRDPHERFDEDKLRMLRAVRFAATFDFSLDPSTLEAIRAHAQEIVLVSAERIAAELRRMLVHPHRAAALRLLAEARLLAVILPESLTLAAESAEWHQMLAVLQRLESPQFATALAALLRALVVGEGKNIVPVVAERWRLSNEERSLAEWLLQSEPLALRAGAAPWPQVQRLLVEPGAAELVIYLRAVESTSMGAAPAADFCGAKLASPAEEWNPSPLVNGDDLKTLGLRPGPHFKALLDTIRDAQLEGRVTDQAAALALAWQLSDIR